MSVETTESVPNPLPTWLSIPIILVCLAGGGWMIHWYVMTDSVARDGKTLSEVSTASQLPRFPQRARNPGQIRSISQRKDGRWDLRTEQARAEISLPKGKPGVIHIITYLVSYASFVPGDAINTILSARGLVNDPARVQALIVTPAQFKQLRELTQTISMVASPADRASLLDAMGAYNAAAVKDRPALEPNIFQRLNEIALRSMTATKDQAIDRAKQINSIITPAMWKAAAPGAAVPAR